MRHLKTLFLTSLLALLPAAAAAGDQAKCKVTDQGVYLCFDGDTTWSCRHHWGAEWHCGSSTFQWATDCPSCTGGDVPEDCDRDDEGWCAWPLVLWNGRGEELTPRDNDCYPCLYGCTETSDVVLCLPEPGTNPGRGGGHYHVKRFKTDPKPQPPSGP